MPNLVLALLLTAVSAPADVAIVCPPAFDQAIAPWIAHRREQGHRLVIVRPGETPQATRQAITEAVDPQSLRHLVLLGDAPAGGEAFVPSSG